MWQTYSPNDLPEPWRYWLGVQGSLTQVLTAAGGQACMLQVQQEGMGEPWPEERDFLSLPALGQHWIREITLSQAQPLVYARSIFPQSLLVECPQFSQLGTQVLASLLFSDPDVRRGAIEVAQLSHEHLLFQSIIAAGLVNEGQSLWARRSRFHRREQQLLVCEVFLDAVNTL